jgi:HAMP domain-containing protein
MGRKQLPKWDSNLFHLAFACGIIALLSSCQGITRFTPAPVETEYETDFHHLERARGFILEGEFKSALSENEMLEKRSENFNGGDENYSLMIMISARTNVFLLKKIIQDQENLSRLSKNLEQKNWLIKKLTEETDRLTGKIREMNTLFKALADLELENKILQQQIRDFKAIDLEGEAINADK